MTNQNLMELGCSTENFSKIQHQRTCQDSTYPQSLFLESLRTGILLMELEMVSGYSIYPREALLQVSSRSNIWKLVKTLSFHMSSKSGEQGCSWWTWWWCYSTQNIPGKLYCEFHQDLASGSFSRLYLSTYPPCLLLESWRIGMFLMELEMVSRYSIYPREALLKVSSRSNIRKFVKTPHILQVTYWSLGGKGCSWWSWR